MLFSRLQSPDRVHGFAEGAYRRIITAVGTDDFEGEVFRSVQTITDLQEISVCLHQAAKAPQQVMQCGVGCGFAERAKAYSAQFFRHDPVNRALDRSPPKGTFIARLGSDDLPDGPYLQAGFLLAGITEKLTVAQGTAQGWLAVNFFAARRRGRLESWEVEELGTFSNLFLPLLDLHGRFLAARDRPARTAPITVEELETRLRSAFPALSGREVSVCARSVAGVTAEGIACDLGIRPTSVLTYRRRAYARLNITSVHQLMTMILQ